MPALWASAIFRRNKHRSHKEWSDLGLLSHAVKAARTRASGRTANEPPASREFGFNIPTDLLFLLQSTLSRALRPCSKLGIVTKHSGSYHPDLRQDRALLPDARALLGQAASGAFGPRAAAPSRSLHHRLLQRRATAPIPQLRTPRQAFEALDKARPGNPVAKTHFRVRTDKVDSCGKVNLCHDSKLFHIAIGRR